MTEKTKQTMTWVLAVAAAALFLASAAGKLSAQPQMVENFRRWGFSDGLRQFVGSAELVGALGLLLPATATLAGCGLAVIMLGAVFVHLGHGEGAIALVPAALLVLVLAVAFARRSAVGKLFGAHTPEAAH